MAVTLKDIARRIGVSYSTVSRAVNRETAKLVNPKTRKRILQAVKKYGYVTNRSAALLKRRIEQAPIIGFTADKFPHFLSGEFSVKVFYGVIEESERFGCDVELFPVQEGSTIDLARQLGLRRALDGVVIFRNGPKHQFCQGLEELQIPTVAIANYESNGSYRNYVYCDGRKGAVQAIDYLFSLNRRRIAIILGSAGSADAESRFEGYREALEHKGFSVEEELVFQGGFDRASGYEATRALIDKLNPLPDAVFCSNDDMAIGALKALYEANIHCPDDIAVVGFDNIDQSYYTTPPLTTVSQPAAELGRRATRLLFDLIQNPDTASHHIEIPTRLVVRQSCGAQILHPLQTP